MFEGLSKYQIILVTGPQRSGTTICAKMIARDTGHAYIDERDTAISDMDAFNYLLVMARRLKSKIVLQCPAICRYIHLYGVKDILAIMMVRPLDVILKSQTRIEWDGEIKERKRYRFIAAEENELPIAQIKYNFWKSDQQHLILNSLEVTYESLSTHPLWIPQEERHNFEPRQTTRENVLGK